MSADHKLDFVLIATVKGFFFNPFRPNGLTFSMERPPTNLTIMPASPEDDGSGMLGGLECRVRCSRSVPPESHTFTAKLLERRFIMYSEAPFALPLLRDGEQVIDASGMIKDGFAVPLGLYPPTLRTLCEEVTKDLHSTLERFFKLIRWQQEIDGPHNVFDCVPSLYWRACPEGNYQRVGRRQQEWKGHSPAGIEWNEIDEREFRELWVTADAAEPLGHELLREARSSALSTPRSALLLAASAVEAGVKMHIAKLAPDTAWLMMETQTPPIYKILRDYLPKLHIAKNVSLPQWNKLQPLFKEMRELAERRNKLTHTGELSADAISRLPNLLNSASDLLYILDAIEGNRWARENIHPPTRTLLGWPSTRRTRNYVSMLVQPDFDFK